MKKRPKKQKSLKPQGRCIFDEKAGLTKEHLWGNSLKKFFPREYTHTHHHVTRAVLGPDGGAIAFHEIMGAGTRPGDPGAVRRYLLCRECNNVWSRKIRAEAEPIILALHSGVQSFLLPDQQLKLARWVTLVTMLAEFEDVPTITIPQSARRAFRDTSQPMEESFIWVGFAETDDFHTQFFHRAYVFNITGRATYPTNRGQQTLLGVGRVLFQHASAPDLGFLGDPIPRLKRFGLTLLSPDGSMELQTPTKILPFSEVRELATMHPFWPDLVGREPPSNIAPRLRRR